MTGCHTRLAQIEDFVSEQLKRRDNEASRMVVVRCSDRLSFAFILR